MSSVSDIKVDFPIFDKYPNLVYLDNSATTQMPVSVIQSISDYYTYSKSNVHRSVYPLSYKSTTLYEDARNKVGQFINADSDEVVFTKNCSESINLVANILAYSDTKWRLDGDSEIILTDMEHHSNIVPWQIIAKRLGIKIKYLSIDKNGQLSIEQLKQLLNNKTAIVAITHISNVLDTVNPIKQIIELTHKYNAFVLVDAAQSISHLLIDVKRLDVDFLAFTGHKMLGPTGIGVLYGKRDILSQCEPFLGGGDMIEHVDKINTTYAKTPHKYEAGTPPIADAIALGVAVDYLNKIGLRNVDYYLKQLINYALTKFLSIKYITVLGSHSVKYRSHQISFIMDNVHPHDIAHILGDYEICVRAGNHCAQFVADRYGISASVRVSFYIYNSYEDVDKLLDKIDYIYKMFN